jgi:hypothetical protein
MDRDHVGDAFEKFVGLRIGLETICLYDRRFDRILELYDAALDSLWLALKVQQKEKTSYRIYEIAVHQIQASTAGWAADLIKSIEGLENCVQRRQIRDVRAWIGEKLMPAVNAKTLVECVTQIAH